MFEVFTELREDSTRWHVYKSHRDSLWRCVPRRIHSVGRKGRIYTVWFGDGSSGASFGSARECLELLRPNKKEGQFMAATMNRVLAKKAALLATEQEKKASA